MNDKIYDFLVFLAQIILPATATLYSALAIIWGFPFGEQIVGTISAIDIFLGSLLKIQNKSYRKRVDGEWTEVQHQLLK